MKAKISKMRKWACPITHQTTVILRKWWSACKDWVKVKKTFSENRKYESLGWNVRKAASTIIWIEFDGCLVYFVKNY